MFDMIKSFPSQIKIQYKNLSALDFYSNRYSHINHIVIAGMGGSAISGDIASNILKDYLDIPMTVVRDYTLPKWVNTDTLVILSSYSGNTEETLSVAKEAILVTKKIVSITTGGELKNISDKNSVPCAMMPAGFQPRAALGYSLTTLLILFNKIHLINKDAIEVFVNATDELESFFKEQCCENQFAHQIAKDISNSVIGIYGIEGSTNVIASRFQAQIAENSKQIASFNFRRIEGHC